MKQSTIQSVGIIIFHKNDVLLVRHGKGSNHFEGVLGIPSGKIDAGENEVQAARRELQEETGLSCYTDDLIALPKSYRGTIEQKDGVNIFDWYVFMCKTYSGELKNSEETEPFWFPIDRLNELALLPNVKEAVRVAFGILSTRRS